MGSESVKGPLLGTLVIGVAVIVGVLYVLPRAVPAPTPVRPSPTPTPRPIAPTTETLHSALASRPADPTIAAGATTTLTFTYRNTGTATWALGAPSQLRLGVATDETLFADLGMAMNWIAPNRPAVQKEQAVEPGQIATLAFDVKGVRAGVYRLPLRPVVDGIAWLEDEKIVLVVTVR